MAEDFETPMSPVEPPRRRSNRTLIIALVVIGLLGCCCLAVAAAGWYLYTYGDQIFGISMQALSLII